MRGPWSAASLARPKGWPRMVTRVRLAETGPVVLEASRFDFVVRCRPDREALIINTEDRRQSIDQRHNGVIAHHRPRKRGSAPRQPRSQPIISRATPGRRVYPMLNVGNGHRLFTFHLSLFHRSLNSPSHACRFTVPPTQDNPLPIGRF